MRTVRRLPLPAEHAADLEQRCARLAACPPYDKVVDTEWNRQYETPLREAMMRVLEEQHQNRCVYCDTPGSATTIEHYYPKKQFPGLMFEWLNLTLACDACQRYKGQPLEFCGAWPLVLDPANETVEPFLYISPEDGRMMAALELQEGELAYKRATETIGRLRLNERWLPRLRLRVVLELRTALESFRRNPGVETEAGILHMLSPEQPWGAVAWQLMTTPEGEFISLVEFCREHSEAVKRCVSRTA